MNSGIVVRTGTVENEDSEWIYVMFKRSKTRDSSNVVEETKFECELDQISILQPRKEEDSVGIKPSMEKLICWKRVRI